ncbi:hypothetical protein K523DRAFT_333780 [Schizophyllum commune Tattone D]|nr:hypothetical protein K523DRAFT_333780 [Schizophyllum commune Tattone D]
MKGQRLLESCATGNYQVIRVSPELVLSQGFRNIVIRSSTFEATSSSSLSTRHTPYASGEPMISAHTTAIWDSCEHPDNSYADLITLIPDESENARDMLITLVYANSHVVLVEEIHDFLRRHLPAGISPEAVEYYHRFVKDGCKDITLQRLHVGDIRICVCTDVTSRKSPHHSPCLSIQEAEGEQDIDVKEGVRAEKGADDGSGLLVLTGQRNPVVPLGARCCDHCTPDLFPIDTLQMGRRQRAAEEVMAAVRAKLEDIREKWFADAYPAGGHFLTPSQFLSDNLIFASQECYRFHTFSAIRRVCGISGHVAPPTPEEDGVSDETSGRDDDQQSAK